MSRMIQLDNQTGDDLHFKERPAGSSSYSHRMTIARGESKSHPANFYWSRYEHGLRTIVIVLCVGQVEYAETLIPSTFRYYSKLTFKLENGELVVTGVPAGSCDFSLIRGLGFLSGFYARRDAVKVLTTSPVQAAGSVSSRQTAVAESLHAFVVDICS